METGKFDYKSDKKAFITALFYEFIGSAIVTYAFTLSSQLPMIRGVAYFVGFLIAGQISGAHFNPATSLAVFCMMKKYKEQLRYFIAVIITQVLGCYLGIFITWLLAKDSSAI